MQKSTRIYTTTKPKHYDLVLSIDRDKMNFSGTVSVEAEVNGQFMLHSKDLKIISTQIDGETVATSHDEKTDELSFDYTTTEATKVTAEVSFEGNITDPMTGMYPCYFEHEDQKKKLIATQFESHHAREVLPCVDEPEAKATFQLTLQVPQDDADAYVSNTPIESEDTADDQVHVKFEKTPVMSTYLLAFVYGEINYLEATSANGTQVRTWATPDNYKNTKFALDVSVKCLDFYNDYFGIDYPLDKCDHIALPDFAAGAMENWGCITYRESALLVDEHTTTDNKQYVAIVVAHELTHQWFGNLVTMKWWNDLWLNEGFASWMEYLAVDSIFPEWQLWTQFVTDDYMRGQGLDSLASTHAIEVPIHNPEEIRSIFDAISYSKGASVIRMLHEYVGAENFKKGMHTYLKRHSYSNTVTTDLWDALSEVCDKNVGEFMGVWTSQAGFPLVTADYDVKSSEYRLSQERFFINPIERENQDDSTLWPVPLTVSSGTESGELTQESTIWQSKKPGKVNVNQTGFYMVSHDDATLSSLMKQIESKELGPIDRLGLLNDNFQLAKAGMKSTSSVLKLISHYGNEDNAAVWDEIAADIGSVRKVMASDELREVMKPYLLKLSQKQFDRLGWKAASDEDYFDTLLRPTILSLASLGENADVVHEALKRFKSSDDLSGIDADLRGVIFGTAVRTGGKKEFDKIHKSYMNSQSSQQKRSLAAALCSFKDESLSSAARDMIMTDDVRLQEVISWFAYLMGNRHSRKATWEWMKQNWDWFVKNFGTDIMTFSYIPAIAGRAFSDSAMYDEFIEFFKTVDTEGIDQKITQGAEALQWQGAWRDRDYETVLNYFKSQ